jgi:hypothetical protein
MWNFAGKYNSDNKVIRWLSFLQRRGERLRWVYGEETWVYFTRRIVLSPNPIMKNPNDVAVVNLLHVFQPEAQKNTMMSSLRYMDPNKADDTYIYLPNMRRVLRGEAGQRSVPVLGGISAMDDFDGFDGRTPEFTYKFVGEQKVLMIRDNKLHASTLVEKKPTELLHYSENYSLVDNYVIDIFSKDPKYPQGKKRIYVDKETLNISYTVVWDRAGKFWKLWDIVYIVKPIPGDVPSLVQAGAWGIDAQFGMANFVASDIIINERDLRWDDVSPAAMLKKGR